MASMSSALRCVAAALVIGLAACSSAGRSSRGDQPARPGIIDAGAFQFEELPAQPLNPGSCGMFLWGQSAGEPVFVLAAYAQPAEARVRIDGRDRTLRRTAAEGQSASGHFERQTYTDRGVSITVDVEFAADRAMVDGVAIEQASMRVLDSDGWETIIPVGGLVGCQP